MDRAAGYNIKILYEDNHVLCALKPRGMLSQADETGDADMLTALKKYIGAKYEKTGRVYLGLVHRLDRPVGGVMVFARTSKAAGRLSLQLRERDVKKTYYAVIRGIPDEAAGRLEHRIFKDRDLNLVRVTETDLACGASAAPYSTAGAHGKPRLNAGASEIARLDYRTLADARDDAGSYALVRVELLTGRPHQIRAQFAHIGHPVVGDRKYGAAGSADWPALWAAELAFSHPVKHTPVTVSAPPPSDEYPWRLFDQKKYELN